MNTTAIVRNIVISLVLSIPTALISLALLPSTAGLEDFSPNAASYLMTGAVFFFGMFIGNLILQRWQPGRKPTRRPSRSRRPEATGPRQTGTVKWFNMNKGFGFIIREAEGDEIFVHFRNIRSQNGRRRLFEGQKVEFSVIEGKKGPQADDVVVIS